MGDLVNLSAHPRFRAAPQLIDRKALMRMWSIKSPTTISNWIREHNLPHTKLPNGNVRFDPVLCSAWLEQFQSER